MDTSFEAIKTNMIDAVTVCFQKYTTFDGRATRGEFWWFALAAFLGSLILSIITSVIGLGVLSMVYSLAILVPSIAVGVRRLHDLNKPGMLYLVILIPLLGALYLIYLFIQEGTKGENEYGADPLS